MKKGGRKDGTEQSQMPLESHVVVRGGCKFDSSTIRTVSLESLWTDLGTRFIGQLANEVVSEIKPCWTILLYGIS